MKVRKVFYIIIFMHHSQISWRYFPISPIRFYHKKHGKA